MRRALVCAAVIISAGVVRADVRASRRDAELLKQKVAAITAQADRPTKAGRRTIVTESEVNSYPAYDAHEQIPVGVVQPTTTVSGGNRLSGRAIVDLDAVRKQKAPTSLLDPMNYLMGRLAVTAVGRLKTANGAGTFKTES